MKIMGEEDGRRAGSKKKLSPSSTHKEP